MKRRILPLLAAVLALALGGCGGDAADTTASAVSTEPAEPGVYFINTDADLDQAWQSLAAAYEAQTGIPVRVETAETLPEELAGSLVTLVSCGDAGWLEKMEGQLLDLSGTGVYSRMTTEKYNWTDSQGHVTAVAYRREAYGLLVNEELLEQAGYSLEMLMDYGMLELMAADIHSRSGELGFDAFAPLSEAEAAELAAELVNAALYYEFRDGNITQTPDSLSGGYLAAGRNFLNLLKSGISEEETARDAFSQGKAVFLPVSTAQAEEDALLMPLYCGIEGEEDGGLWESRLRRWAVNANAPQVRIDATLDFLNWVVTGEAGTQMLAGIQCRRLFEDVPAAEAETVTVEWVPGRVALDAARLEAAGAAMVGYLTSQNDWSAVEKAFAE